MGTRRAKAAVDPTDAPRTEDAPIELMVVGAEPANVTLSRSRRTLLPATRVRRRACARTPLGPSAWDFIWSQMVEWTEQTDGLLASVMRSPDSRTVARARRIVGRGRRLVEALLQLSTGDSGHAEQVQEVERIVVPHLRELEAVLWVVELDTIEAPADGDPVTTWKGAAHVLGISEDTLFARRKGAGNRSRPWWPSAEATRTWFEGVKAARPPGKPQRRPKTQPPGAAVDWDRVKL